MITMKPVESSNIAAIGFDASKSELHVRFKSGTAWAYAGVPTTLRDAVARADGIRRHRIGERPIDGSPSQAHQGPRAGSGFLAALEARGQGPTARHAQAT